MIRLRSGFGPRGRRGLGEVGFTLIELLVVIGLLTIVVGLLMYPLLGGFTFLSKGKARHEASAATRFGMDVMSRELSNAIDVILVTPQFIVFVLPNMRTHCPEDGGHWLRDPQGQPYYSYYCPIHNTANVRHELVEPVAPMRNAAGERVAIVYFVAKGGEEAAGEYLARAVVPFPEAAALQDRAAWRTQIGQVTPAALTPTGEHFSIEMLHFAPTAIGNEVLTPYWRGRDSDYSIYRARYPLWKPGRYAVEIRNPAGNPVARDYEVDTRSGTVSFAVEEKPPAASAAYDPENPLIPPVLGGLAGYGRIVRGTEVVIGPAADAFVRARVVSAGRAPVLGREPEEGEYWIDYETGKIYVNGTYAQGDPPALFAVRFMHHQIDRDDYSVIASYQTYALLNIDLTVRKTEAESGRAAPEGILGSHQDFHISGKVKLLNVAR